MNYFKLDARFARYPIFYFDKDFNNRAEKYGDIDPQADFFELIFKKSFFYLELSFLTTEMS